MFSFKKVTISNFLQATFFDERERCVTFCAQKSNVS